MSQEKKRRNDAIIEKYQQLGWGYKRIGAYFGLYWTTVRTVIKRKGAIKGKYVEESEGA